MRGALFFFAALVLVSCAKSPEQFELNGNAQGTTFSIKYHGTSATDLSKEVAASLNEIDESLSLWRPDSFISRLNARTDSMIGIPGDDKHFLNNFKRSKIIFYESAGAFDPSVYPLVKAWGFGAIAPDSEETPNVDSLKKAHSIGGFNVILGEVGAEDILILPAGMQLDFNAIAQGYSVDVVAELLEKNGISDYLVEIGGELRASGKRLDGKTWNVGIDRPVEGERSLIREVEVKNESLATSGNYRKALIRDGKRYSHTIDPISGYPVTHNLLSATVVTKDCASADAYATVCMVLGTEKAMEFAKKKNLEVYLISEENGAFKETGTGRFSQ
jgi:thiamine biosynthesis lipoprotein